MSNLIEFADMLYSEGFNPIPVNNLKVPLVPANCNHLYERKMPITYNFNSFGIAITCGIASEGLEVIDFDKHQGQDIKSIFDEFIKNPIVSNLINEGLIAIYQTPSGGYHIMYRTDLLESSKKLSLWEDGNIMIETKSAGGYVVCYPTMGYIHISGCELVKISKIETEERNYLIDLAKSFSFLLKDVY